MLCYINMKEVLNHFEFPVLLLKFAWELIKGLGEFLQFIVQRKKTLICFHYRCIVMEHQSVEEDLQYVPEIWQPKLSTKHALQNSGGRKHVLSDVHRNGYSFNMYPVHSREYLYSE